MSVDRPARYLLFLLLLGLGSCPAPEGSVSAALAFGPAMDLPAPSPADAEDLCAEVGALRVCWPAGGGAPRRVPRTLPALATPGGWRCWGGGATRRCQPRSVGAGPWVCNEGSGCRRGHPRLPGDGEWECTDLSGVVLCRHHGESAGVIAGPPDPAWICGGEPRICVDFSPDLPVLSGAGRLDCRFPVSPDQSRACVRVPEGGLRVGEACRASEACPEGTACLSGHCLPTAAPDPSCWTGKDCSEGGRCVFGTCVGAAG